ncbi:hypothetical protein OSH11_21165 [Kaistia dalseonensis]|uniref:Uncharacterized protein n=1 Tax=Kaistia dalseonensis TaxID=410840 RepID=A0ABU0HD33_9HYPH|nr:hypothetical protein [Kaistia dalseonensis]MCX5497226.1 hypothetical protein [Kaistia dalseonensis]MDQ0439857.1 hypothetical protein [Kaistia dalseonensis]
MIDARAVCDQYMQSRYLREASDESPQQRLAVIANNLWSTRRDGEVTQPRSLDRRREMLELYTHVLREQMERSKSVELVIDEAAIRHSASSSYVQRQTVRPITFAPDCYAKFGQKEHILSALAGKLFIQPAANYNDSSLNAAQLDNELLHHVSTPNERLIARLYGLDGNGNEVEIEPHWSELFRYMNVPNFYVWCCGLGYDARLFSDFKADAALVVKDKTAFEERLVRAMETILPDAEIRHGTISYYDPYTTRHDQLIPAFSKNIIYLYQNEYRFIWQLHEERELKPFLIDLGSLDDIAEVVELASESPFIGEGMSQRVCFWH